MYIDPPKTESKSKIGKEWYESESLVEQLNSILKRLDQLEDQQRGMRDRNRRVEKYLSHCIKKLALNEKFSEQENEVLNQMSYGAKDMIEREQRKTDDFIKYTTLRQQLHDLKQDNPEFEEWFDGTTKN